MDYRAPSSSVHGISQARMLEWVAISYFRGSSQPRDRTHVSCVSWSGRQVIYHCATCETPKHVTCMLCSTQQSIKMNLGDLSSLIWKDICFFLFFSILHREFHGLYSPWGRKESDTIERLSVTLWIYIYIYMCVCVCVYKITYIILFYFWILFCCIACWSILHYNHTFLNWYSCFTMFYWCLICNKVDQLYVYIHPLPIGPPSHS